MLEGGKQGKHTFLAPRITRPPRFSDFATCLSSWNFTKLDDFLPFIYYMSEWSLHNKKIPFLLMRNSWKMDFFFNVEKLLRRGFKSSDYIVPSTSTVLILGLKCAPQSNMQIWLQYITRWGTLNILWSTRTNLSSIARQPIQVKSYVAIICQLDELTWVQLSSNPWLSNFVQFVFRFSWGYWWYNGSSSKHTSPFRGTWAFTWY